MATPLVAADTPEISVQMGEVGGMSGRKRFARRFLRNKVAMVGGEIGRASCRERV